MLLNIIGIVRYPCNDGIAASHFEEAVYDEAVCVDSSMYISRAYNKKSRLLHFARNNDSDCQAELLEALLSDVNNDEQPRPE